jgi:hypothetical protein
MFLSKAEVRPPSGTCHERTFRAHRFCLVEQCLESARKHRPIKRDYRLPYGLMVCVGCSHFR